MEITYRIICALCIIFLQFPLYYLAPVENISYTDIMNNDRSLCDNPIKQFLSKSEYTKECATLSYPRNIDKLTLQYITVDTFLCLGMYDATYKVCQYTKSKKWTSTFSKKEDLDLSIQNVTGFKSTGENISQNLTLNEDNFCKHLSGYKPTYEKVKPALLKLAESLKEPLTCNKICIDINHKLNPLCAILAWINWLDQTVINNTIATSTSELGKKLTESSTIHRLVKDEEKTTTADTDHRKEPANTVDEISPVKMGKDNTVEQTIREQKPKGDNSKLPIDPAHSATNDASKGEIPLVEKVNDKNNLIKSPLDDNKTTLQADVSQPEKPLDQSHLKPDIKSQPLNSAATDTQQLPKNVEPKDDIADNNKKSNMNKNVYDKSISSLIEEIKSTTLSENTQDNAVEDNVANNPNPDEFRVDDDHLSDNLNDGLSQSMDAGGRNDNIPDTSGQRETESNLVIKNDEESHFFTYFAITSLGFIAGYIAYHNKQKILAIVLEGRRSKNNRNRRRPSTANYRKLDCTLEEAVTSQCNANVTHVIY